MTDVVSMTLTKEEQTLIDALEKLNVVQLNNVVMYMEKTYGISTAAPPAAAAASAGAPAGAAAPAKKVMDIELTETGTNKIAVIKLVREVTGLGLSDAKAAVDGAPKVIKEKVKTAEAEEVKKKLETAGAKVTLK